ncbi:MAG: glycosyltransferase, partial [Planctomycetales bacterium]|nr:glycosyltransferase [Planctomycetales bacterium]
PAHRDAAAAGLPLDETGIELEVAIGAKQVRGSLLHSTLPGSSVPVYLVHQPDYFDRPGIYGDSAGDYEDNCERFVFFCRAVLQAMVRLDLEIDLVHLNDWPTGLIPAYLRIEHAGDPAYERIATLFTIHNLAYQGTFWHWDMLLTGLDWKYFNWRQMEFHGQLNFMKTGLVFSDALNTVSPTYAQEIQSPPLGCYLDGLLRHRREHLSGIINGVDYTVWNPASDPQIACRYDASSVAAGKAACKAALQAELGLAVAPDTPLVGVVGRLVDQKGLDLILPVMRQLAPSGSVQWAVLGSGAVSLEKELRQLAAEFPHQIAARIGFSDQLAHRIEAAADMFVMPSRYEP